MLNFLCFGPLQYSSGEVLSRIKILEIKILSPYFKDIGVNLYLGQMFVGIYAEILVYFLKDERACEWPQIQSEV